jgi:hypothetical protein
MLLSECEVLLFLQIVASLLEIGPVENEDEQRAIDGKEGLTGDGLDTRRVLSAREDGDDEPLRGL